MEMRFLKYYFLSFITVACLCIGFNAIVDPLQYYRRNTGYPLCENDRWQVAAFIHKFNFDTAVVGTSLTQNISLQRIRNQMGGNPIRLSIAGATIPEQLIVLKTALKTGKLKRVIWGVDRPYFSYPANMTLPTCFYKRRGDAHIRYLLNLDTLAQSLRVLLHQGNIKSHEALDSYNSWWQKEICAKDITLKIYEKELAAEQKSHQVTHKFRNEILADLLLTVKTHPDVEFILFFPPYSLAYHKKQYHVNRASYEDDYEFRKLLLNELLKINNVKVFDFETNLEMISDLNNYKDLSHYGKKVSDQIVDGIAKQKQILAVNQINNSQANFQKLPFQTFK
jgi:hypothetical protein